MTEHSSWFRIFIAAKSDTCGGIPSLLAAVPRRARRNRLPRETGEGEQWSRVHEFCRIWPKEGQLYQYHEENTHLYVPSPNSRLQISVLSVKIILINECALLRTR
jgi:hypothetical protein